MLIQVPPECTPTDLSATRRHRYHLQQWNFGATRQIQIIWGVFIRFGLFPRKRRSVQFLVTLDSSYDQFWLFFKKVRNSFRKRSDILNTYEKIVLSLEDTQQNSEKS